MSRQPPGTPFAHRYWFPLAALYSALIVPWSVGGQVGWWLAPAGLRTGWGHGHEMLFGYALAVVAGFLLGPQPRRQTVLLCAVWLSARIAFLCWPQGALTGLLNAAVVLALAYKLVPVFLKTAKKWRNRSVAAIVIGLALSVAGFHLAVRAAGALPIARSMLLEAVLLLSALMFFIGGRMLAPAIAGHLQDKHIRLQARVQPTLEAAVLLLMATLLLVRLLPFGWIGAAVAVLLFACAALTAIRMWRWRLRHCVDRVDFLALLLGYGWLIVGWSAVGCSLIGCAVPLPVALHAITAGALGTLSVSVMIRTRMIRCLKDPNAIPWAYALPALVSIAALLRLCFPLMPTDEVLMAAAALWSAAFLGVFALLSWLDRQADKGPG